MNRVKHVSPLGEVDSSGMDAYIKEYLAKYRRFGLGDGDIIRYALLCLAEKRGKLSEEHTVSKQLLEDHFFWAQRCVEISILVEGCDIHAELIRRIADLELREIRGRASKLDLETLDGYQELIVNQVRKRNARKAAQSKAGFAGRGNGVDLEWKIGE